MNARFRLLWIVLLATGLVGCASPSRADAPHAVNGRMDLSGWNFNANGTVQLDGQWDFYWHRLYSPEDLRQATPKPVPVQVPAIWNGYRIDGRSLPGTGYATYRLRIHTGDPEQVLAIRIPYASTAYTLWINGKKAAGNGVVGTDAASSKPQYLNRTVSFRGDADLIVQISNFQHRRGGLFQPLTLGTTEQIARMTMLHGAEDSFLFGGLFVIGLYYLVLFQFRRRARHHLYFGLICILLAIHTLCEDEVMLTQLIPHFNWELELKIEYITADLSKILLFPLFFQARYPGLLHRRMLQASAILAGIFFLTPLATPALIFTRYYALGNLADTLIMLYLWAMLLKAMRDRRDGAGIIFGCFTGFILTVFNDILYATGWIQTGYSLDWGLDFFVLGQALLLAGNVSKSFSLAENLAGELKQLNQTLELKVANRTRRLETSNEALRQSNEQLQQKNQQIQAYEYSRKQLLTNISHELRTPITLIQGYLEALIYEVIQDSGQRKKHLLQIHAKTLQLNQLIEDLFELSRLEARQSAMAIRKVDARAWALDVLARYAEDVEQHGLRCISEIALPKEDGTCYLRIDAARLEQVLSNLVYNAIKYTPANGTIVLRAETCGEHSGTADNLRVTVADNGPGIPPSDLPHLFERFYRAKGESGQPGTGLGLAIAKAIVEQHQGHIGVESRVGYGSRFYFTLPVSRPH